MYAWNQGTPLEEANGIFGAPFVPKAFGQSFVPQGFVPAPETVRRIPMAPTTFVDVQQRMGVPPTVVPAAGFGAIDGARLARQRAFMLARLRRFHSPHGSYGTGCCF